MNAFPSVPEKNASTRRAAAATLVRYAKGERANRYSSFVRSRTRSTAKSGNENSASMPSAAAYSLRQARLDKPPRNWTASVSDDARKKTRVRQNRLNTTTRCAHTDSHPPSRPAVVGVVDGAGEKIRRSIARAAPWIAPKTTNVQFAPCQRPARSMVSRRFRAVLDGAPELPPRGMYT